MKIFRATWSRPKNKFYYKCFIKSYGIICLLRKPLGILKQSKAHSFNGEYPSLFYYRQQAGLHLHILSVTHTCICTEDCIVASAFINIMLIVVPSLFRIRMEPLYNITFVLFILLSATVTVKGMCM